MKPPPLTDDEEADIQAAIAADPDAWELADDARLRPARDVLPRRLFEALTRGRAAGTIGEPTGPPPKVGQGRSRG